MEKIISAAILLVIAWAILYFLVPFVAAVSVVLGTIITVLVAVGAIVGLMKIAGLWF